jgi:hypothetical protein
MCSTRRDQRTIRGHRKLMQPITVDELAKAAANLKRIEDYLAIRTQWRTEEGAASALRSIDDGAIAITRTLDPYRDSHPITVEWGDPKLPEQLPSDTFDVSRTAKLGEFMVQLSAWFKDRAGPDLVPGTEQLIGSIYSSLMRIHGVVESILGGSPARRAPTDPHRDALQPSSPSGSSRATGESPQPAEGDTGHPMAMPPPTTPAARSKRLVLENTVQAPLLEALQDEYELTAAAKQIVTGFLEENGIEFAGHKLRRFHAEVRRCIERTPEGQVLVIKIGGFDGERSPFFTYQPKAWVDR